MMPHDVQTEREKFGPLAKAMYFLATVQITWYYLGHVSLYMYRWRYEHGVDRMPFQGRLMMMFLLRWSHHSAACITMVNAMKKIAPWVMPYAISPETILQICVDIACVALTGVIATRIYQASSKERLLIFWVYPLVLVMCVTTYMLHTMQNLRYYYDFPSLLFFSAGLYLIYFRHHPALFAALFLVGTINRETTLFLLLFYVLAYLARNGPVNDGSIDWRRLRDLRIWVVVAPLAAAWLAWHVWVGWVFRQNSSEFSWRLLVNLGLVLLPLSWPQMLGAGCYMFPVIFLFRRSIQDPILRIWLWTLPAWFGLMFFYGILIETRIFGELIAYLACLTALIAEQEILTRLKGQGWLKIPEETPDTITADCQDDSMVSVLR